MLLIQNSTKYIYNKVIIIHYKCLIDAIIQPCTFTATTKDFRKGRPIMFERTGKLLNVQNGKIRIVMFLKDIGLNA